MRLRFGDCAIDVERRELRRSGTVVHVEPQVFDLLLHLIRNRNQVVSKEQLLAPIWEGRIVSDSALSTRINAARHAIGDSGERQQLIQTIARRGFRFVAETEEVIAQDASVAVPERPSIAIMAFANMRDDPEQSYFAEGMAEDLITSLSHIRWLTVIARNSSFSYKGRSVDARQIGRELSVRYILDGSVRRAGDLVRITAQLLEAETGAHLWAGKFDGDIKHVFSLQDQITASVIGAIEPSLRSAEVERARRKRPDDLNAL
jgi:TolB-like protein